MTLTAFFATWANRPIAAAHPSGLNHFKAAHTYCSGSLVSENRIKTDIRVWLPGPVANVKVKPRSQLRHVEFPNPILVTLRSVGGLLCCPTLQGWQRELRVKKLVAI